jgi:anaphase-promoting complex subunit 3
MAPAVAHLILGAIALDQGEAETASFHLEQAYRLHPPTSTIVNNLAGAFAIADPPQLDRALAFADAAVKLDPNHPRVHYTRGGVLAKLKRWEEARDEFETALLTWPDEPQLHLALADIYKELGDDERAAEHRRKAEEKPETKTADER